MRDECFNTLARAASAAGPVLGRKEGFWERSQGQGQGEGGFHGGSQGGGRIGAKNQPKFGHGGKDVGSYVRYGAASMTSAGNNVNPGR